MKPLLRLLSVLLLAANAFAVQRGSAIPTVHMSGELLNAGFPGVSAAATAAMNRQAQAVSRLVGEGPVAVIETNGQVLLIPTAAKAGMEAVSVAADGSDAARMTITREMAAGLAQALKADDAAGAAAAFASVYERSRPSAEPAVFAAAPDSAARPVLAFARAPRAPKTGDAKAEPPAPSAVADKAKPKWESAQPLPDLRPEDVVASALPDLDSALEMTISHSYPGKPGSDPTKQVADFIDSYIAAKDLPNAEKHLVLTYFEIGDKMNGGHSAVVSAIERAAKAGLKVTIITDFNQSAEGAFPKDEPHNTDFESLTYKKGGPGKALQYLREQLGFKLRFGEGKLTVLSGVPLFNPREKGEKPLAHDKGAFALGKNGKAWGKAVVGTANMNATEETAAGALPSYGGRYNRVLTSKDPASNQIDWDDMIAQIEVFDRRLGSKAIPADRDFRKRVTYASGEYRERLRTNGRQNPNDRITATLARATQALKDALANKTQPDFEIEEIIYSHFVFTHTPQMDALRHYLDALREFYPNDFAKRVKITGLFDQQFISPDGFGEVAALDGELVQRPMGKSIFPFRSEYKEMMDLRGYVRLLDGADKIDPDGAPTKVHIYHDKTTVMKVKENGQRWTYAWTRSLNNSGHFQSLESQDELRMRPDSRLAKDFEDSVKEVAKAEPQYALSLDKVIVMFVMAHAAHHTIYDQGLQGLAEKLVEALSKQSYAVVGDLLNQALALPTKHVKGVVDAQKVKDRVAKFVGFLAWYKQQRDADKTLNFMTYRKAINVLVGLTSGNAWNMRTSLDILYFGGRRTPEEMDKLMRQAWSEGLKLDLPYPEPKPRPSA